MDYKNSLQFLKQKFMDANVYFILKGLVYTDRNDERRPKYAVRSGSR